MSGWDDADLDHLRRLEADRRAVERRIAQTVAYLRQRECPWSEVGEALGVSKQAAQQRFRSIRTSTVDRPLLDY